MGVGSLHKGGPEEVACEQEQRLLVYFELVVPVPRRGM